MFKWTLDSALAAIEAGILSVQSIYNDLYTYALRTKGLTPANGNAHAYAMNQLVIYLNQTETERLAVAAVDATYWTIVNAANYNEAMRDLVAEPEVPQWNGDFASDYNEARQPRSAQEYAAMRLA